MTSDPPPRGGHPDPSQTVSHFRTLDTPRVVLVDAVRGARTPPSRPPEVNALLAQHLLGRRTSADLGQVLAAAATAWALWPSVDRRLTLGWLALVVITAALRGWNRRRIAPDAPDPWETLRFVRRDVLISASVWAIWAILLIGAPIKDLAFLLLILSGLVAAGTSTLVADVRSFAVFLAMLLTPAAFTVAASGTSRDHIALLLLMAVFAAFMLHVHSRAHAILVAQARTRVELQRSEQAAAANSRFLDTLIRSAPSPIVVLTQNHFILTVNPAFEKMFGLDAERVRDRRFMEVVPEGGARASLQALLESVGSSAPSVTELSLPRPDGDTVWLRISATRSTDAEHPMIVLAAEEVTALVRAAEEQERARQAAEEAAHAKGSFLARMSHEIRTPMNGVLGMLELVSGTELTSEQSKLVDAAMSSGRSLMNVLNDVLDFSKLEAGRVTLEEIPFDLHHLVADVARLNAQAAAHRGNEIVVDDDPAIPAALVGDPGRIRQVLANLVTNAVKFTEHGKVAIVTRLLDRDGEWSRVSIQVEDSGIGIPPDRLSAIFEEFSQADVSMTRRYGGTGLGLAISRSLAHQMGGRLEVDSTLGRGSTFTFSVRLREAVDRPRPRARGQLEGRRFLVLDDSSVGRAFARAALEGAGAIVAEADDAGRALERIRTAIGGDEPFDGVVVDSTLTDRDGFSFVATAREDPALCDTRFLLVTSTGDTGVTARARTLGIGAVLDKPVSTADLVTAAEALLGLRPPARERRVVTREALAESRGGLRILLVEDNAVNQTIARAMLTKRGHAVDLAENGVEAVDMALSQEYDVVLMDLEMPEMGGIEATRRIREHHDAEALRIVALTAHALAAERARCAAAGMNDFLSKPFSAGELYAVVEAEASHASEA